MENGKWEKKVLSSMKVYNAIRSVVKEKIESGKNDNLEAILFLSAEFNAINNAILQGSKLENLALSPLILNAPNNYSPSCSIGDK